MSLSCSCMTGFVALCFENPLRHLAQQLTDTDHLSFVQRLRLQNNYEAAVLHSAMHAKGLRTKGTHVWLDTCEGEGVCL